VSGLRTDGAFPMHEATAKLLHDLAGLSMVREERFDRITRTAAALFDSKAAFLGLLDDEKQWIKGCVGVEIPVLPRRETFCQHVIVQGRLLVVPDLTKDPRFCGHEIVTVQGFRFYAGQPLRIRGHVIGTLCLLDDRVRPDLTEQERARLADLAAWAETEILAVETELAERRRPGTSVLGTISKRDELILQFVDTAICGIDAEGFVTFANPAAAELLGERLANLVGTHFTSRYPHHPGSGGEPRSWQDSPIAEAIRTATTRRVTNESLHRADGGRIDVEYQAAPLVVDSEVLGAVLTIADVSDRRAVERLKDEFVSVVSHELRTPLTSIRGSLGLLGSGKFGELPAQGARLVQIALDNTERLVRLVNDILDLERIEAGRADLHPRVQPLAPMLDAARDAVAGSAAGVGVTVTCAAPPVLVDADSDFLVRAFTNLLGNAVKFSPAGATVTITAEVTGDQVAVAVTDRGRGIPPDRVDRVFERFEQVDASDAREKGGTGLGLAITRSIVERHGGRIEVASTLGEGSVFTVTLPVAPGVPARAGTGGDDRPAVVIVEDDDDLVEVLTAALGGHPVDVASARGVDEAVALVHRLRPALVVLDIQLADGDGYEVARRLRKDPETASVPLVVATVHELDDAKRARLALGPTTVVAKGTTGSDIVGTVLSAVRRHVLEPSGPSERETP
jgi:PAS domain S-box-containing protein